MLLPSNLTQQEDDMRTPNYEVEVRNIFSQRWECFSTARTLDEAFDIAERAVGFSIDYDEVEIVDAHGFTVWASNGFRQGEGLKLMTLEEVRRANQD